MHLSRKILRGFLVLFATALALLVIAVIWVGSSFLFFDFNDGYAQWGAADMVIEYMESHDDHWPPNWEALRENFESGRGYLMHVGGTFEEFQKRIFIDFQADPEQLRKQSLASDDAQFDVIHAGWGSVRFGEGPNAVLRNYFRRKAGIIDAPRPFGGWPTLHEKEIANEWYKRGASVQFDEQEDVVAVWTALSDPLIHSLSDADLSDLRTFKHLKRLNVVGSRVTDAGLAYLKDIPTLEELNLGGTGITDAGLANLSGHPGLAQLDLFDTRVTDAGLRHLRTLHNLMSLRLDETKIGKKAVSELKSQLPALAIENANILPPPPCDGKTSTWVPMRPKAMNRSWV